MTSSSRSASFITTALRHRRVFQLDGRGDGLLVLNENYRKGWVATGVAEGSAVEPYEELLAVRATGPGQVVLEYRPASLPYGAAGSAFGLLLLILWATGRLRALRRPRLRS